MIAPQWDSVARVYRSPCHRATWIGYLLDAVQDEASLPAGPLRVVKAALVELAKDDGLIDRYRWRHDPDGDFYELQVVWRS